MHGTNISLSNLLQILNNHFAFLQSYIEYSEDPMDPNIVYYKLTTKGESVMATTSTKVTLPPPSKDYDNTSIDTTSAIERATIEALDIIANEKT